MKTISCLFSLFTLVVTSNGGTSVDLAALDRILASSSVSTSLNAFFKPLLEANGPGDCRSAAIALFQKIDPNFDPEHFPSTNIVASSEKYRSGTSPENIADLEERAQYKEAIAKEREYARSYSIQSALCEIGVKLIERAKLIEEHSPKRELNRDSLDEVIRSFTRGNVDKIPSPSEIERILLKWRKLRRP